MRNPHAAKLLKRFEVATREHEFMGSQPPEDHDRIQRRFDKAKRELADYMEKK